MRKLILAANDISGSAYNRQGKTPHEVLDYAQKRVLEISDVEGQHREGFVELKRLVTGSIDRIEELFESEAAITGIATGLYRFRPHYFGVTTRRFGDSGWSTVYG